MKCHACESTAIYIDGLCEGCYNDLCSGADDATMVAEKLVSVIAAKDARIAELEQCFDSERQRHHDTGARIPPLMARIAELEAQLSEAQLFVEVRLAAIRRLDTIIAAYRTNEQAQADKIIEAPALPPTMICSPLQTPKTLAFTKSEAFTPDSTLIPKPKLNACGLSP